MYQLTTGWPQRTTDKAFVNPDGAEYLSWLAAGNTPLPPEPDPEPTPEQQLAATDAEMARVVEDVNARVDLLVATLKAAKVITDQDAADLKLNANAQEKIDERDAIREKLK